MTVDKYIGAAKKAYKSDDGNAHIEMHHNNKQNQRWKRVFMISNVAQVMLSWCQKLHVR